MKNRYTVHREKASQDQLENMHKLIKENLDKNREEDKKYNIQRKYVLVTGDSWAQGELDESKDSDWSATHSVSGYLASEFPNRYVAVGFPNPGWDDFESIYVLDKMHHMFDYLVFSKHVGYVLLCYKIILVDKILVSLKKNLMLKMSSGKVES